MARRLFSTKIVDSDAFLDMSPTAQNLYFHLGMRADDDGFVGNPKKILRMVGGNDDDLKILIFKRFVLSFESGVVVIKHWLIHNTIRKDRYNQTQYLEEKNSLIIKENGSYTEREKELGNQMATNRIPKLSKVKLSQDKLSKDNSNINVAEIQTLINLFKNVNPSYKQFFANKTERACLERLLKEHGREKLTEIIEVLPKTNLMEFAPVITSPFKLEKKLGDLLAFVEKQKGKITNKKIITL